MKKLFGILLLALIIISCHPKEEINSISSVNWKERSIDHEPTDSMVNGETYLSVYSQIYSQTEHRKHDLTATVSLRNTDHDDTIYIDKAEYFDTKGKSIRNYFKKTIFIAPMETVEIIIDENDKSGGTGANFLFSWRIKQDSSKPVFEGVMISTSGQQGLSFTTQGRTLD